jgi:glutamate dehydrogenase (NAD(P)+)
MNFSLCREILEADGHQQGELDDVLTVPVDVLFPCAVQNVVREDNVDSICASSVVEGANNPLTPQARQALHQRDIPVIPDIIANPGGSIAAFVELTSNISNEENIRTRGKTELAKTLTRDKIAENVRQLLAISNNTEADLVDAAHFLAYERIFANETLR